MAIGDWLIYYSPKERFEESAPCQMFTAIGKVIGEVVYPFVPMRPLLDQLSFIKDKRRWGTGQL